MNSSIEEKIETVLDKLRPFLQREGGDIRLDHYDPETGVCYVDMVGACAGCVMASTDVSESIEVMVLDEVPEVKKVELIAPQEPSFDDLLRRLAEQQLAEEDLRRQQEKQSGSGESK